MELFAGDIFLDDDGTGFEDLTERVAAAGVTVSVFSQFPWLVRTPREFLMPA